MKQTNTNPKKEQAYPHPLNHGHSHKNSCCGDCKGGGACHKIKIEKKEHQQ